MNPNNINPNANLPENDAEANPPQQGVDLETPPRIDRNTPQRQNGTQAQVPPAPRGRRSVYAPAAGGQGAQQQLPLMPAAAGNAGQGNVFARFQNRPLIQNRHHMGGNPLNHNPFIGLNAARPQPIPQDPETPASGFSQAPFNVAIGLHGQNGHNNTPNDPVQPRTNFSESATDDIQPLDLDGTNGSEQNDDLPSVNLKPKSS